MKVGQLAVLLFTSLSAGGCGLLWLPGLDAYPAPVKSIEVHDASTGKIVSDAVVDFYVVPCTEKSDPGWLETTFFAMDQGAGHTTHINVAYLGGGRFQPGTATMLSGWQCLWPLFSWSTEGDWEYYGHFTRFAINAPGYREARVEFAPEGSAENLNQALAFDGHHLDSTGVLDVRLSPRDDRDCDSCDAGALRNAPGNGVHAH